MMLNENWKRLNLLWFKQKKLWKNWRKNILLKSNHINPLLQISQWSCMQSWSCSEKIHLGHHVKKPLQIQTSLKVSSHSLRMTSNNKFWQALKDTQRRNHLLLTTFEVNLLQLVCFALGLDQWKITLKH